MVAPRWIVVRTKPNCEKQAIRNLENQEFRYYRPEILRRRLIRKQVKMVGVSLFPNYIFVQITDRYHALNSTYGIAAVVGNNGAPSIVQDQIIEGLRRLEKNGFIQLPEGRRLRVGDGVTIQAGALAGQRALVARMPAKERQKILLALLDNKINVLVEEHDLLVTE